MLATAIVGCLATMIGITASVGDAHEERLFTHPSDAPDARAMIVRGPTKAFGQSITLRRWEGSVVARADGRVFDVDQGALTAQPVDVDGALVVQDVATAGHQIAALVRRTEAAGLSLLIADRGEAPRRWTEHALPAAKLSFSDGSIRLAGGDGGLAVFGTEAAYFLAEDGWHQAPSRQLTEQGPSEIFWSCRFRKLCGSYSGNSAA